MALDPCTPCACDPGYLGNDPRTSREAALRILCSILDAIISGPPGGSCTCVLDGAVAAPGDTGNIVAGFDGTNFQFLSTDATGALNVLLTQLPAPAVLADNTANPTISKISTFGMLFDGATWDRQPGNSVDGTLVNLGANNDVVVTNAGGATAVNIQDGGNSITIDGTVSVTGLPAAAALADNTANPTLTAIQTFGMVFDGATWDRMPGTSVDGVLVNLGANNDVTITGTVTTSQVKSTTGTQSSVAYAAGTQTLQASNAARLAETIYNDSDQAIYVNLGAAASATVFTVKLFPNGYYEVPGNYTGIITGLWAAVATGSARMTELT